MIGAMALAIEMGADAVDIGKTNHPYPTLMESIGIAAEVAQGRAWNLHGLAARQKKSVSAHAKKLRTGTLFVVFCLLCLIGRHGSLC